MDGLVPFDYTVRVLSFKQFLPAGPTADGGFRKQDLVQLWTDPGGLRTLALADIRLGRRNKRKTTEVSPVNKDNEDDD